MKANIRPLSPAKITIVSGDMGFWKTVGWMYDSHGLWSIPCRPQGSLHKWCAQYKMSALGGQILQYISRMKSGHPVLYNTFLRPIKYVFLTVILLTIPLQLFSINQYFNKTRGLSVDFTLKDAVYAAVLAPFIESVIVIVIYHYFRKFSYPFHVRVALFSFIIFILAWLAHGASFGSLFPSVMFASSAIYIARTLDFYKLRDEIAFSGAVTLHCLYNLPFTIKVLLRLLS